jgi:hypothetical protein
LTGSGRRCFIAFKTLVPAEEKELAAGNSSAYKAREFVWISSWQKVASGGVQEHELNALLGGNLVSIV